MKIAEHGPSLASLQELVDSVPALIHTAHPDGSIDFFNQRWLEFVGLRLEDLEGWKWTAAVHPDDVSALVAKWRACLVSGESFELESRVRRVDGAYRWMLHQKLPLRTAGGEIVKWYGSSVDIDDRKQAEFLPRGGTSGSRTSAAGHSMPTASTSTTGLPELFAIHGLAPGGKAPTVAEYMAVVQPGRSRVRRAINSEDVVRASRIRLHETDCVSGRIDSSCSVRRRTGDQRRGGPEVLRDRHRCDGTRAPDAGTSTP